MPREGAESPPVEIFQNIQKITLCHVLWDDSMSRDVGLMNHFVILWNLLKMCKQEILDGKEMLTCSRI